MSDPIEIFQELIIDTIEILDSDISLINIVDEDELQVGSIHSQGLIGPPGSTYQGFWVLTQPYAARSVVLYNGGLYINNTTATIDAGHNPSNGSPWTVYLPKPEISIGDLSVNDIPDLPASKITSGILDEQRLPANLQGTTSNVQTQLNYLAEHGFTGYTHYQNIAASVWVINHNLNRYPSITVVDSTGRVVEGDEEYVSANQIILRFSAGFSGIAYLN